MTMNIDKLRAVINEEVRKSLNESNKFDPREQYVTNAQRKRGTFWRHRKSAKLFGFGAKSPKGSVKIFAGLGANSENLAKNYGRPKLAEQKALTEGLTKKDFIAMAREIRNAPKVHQGALINFAITLAKNQNSQFDEKRFREAVFRGKGI